MLPKSWQNIYIVKPKGLKAPTDAVPLSRLYDSGYFISAIFGSEAWVINSKDYYAQPLHIISNNEIILPKSMIAYNERQYKKFLSKVKQQRRESHLLAHQNHFE